MGFFQDLFHFLFVEHYLTTVWVIALMILYVLKKYASEISEKTKSFMKKYSVVLFLNLLSFLLTFGKSNDLISQEFLVIANYFILITVILDFIILVVKIIKFKRGRKNAKRKSDF